MLCPLYFNVVIVHQEEGFRQAHAVQRLAVETGSLVMFAALWTIPHGADRFWNSFFRSYYYYRSVEINA